MGPDPIPISALQHYIFCPRQCALIHIEGLWAENRLTVEGRVLHERAHAERTGPRGGGRHESRPGIRTVRGLALCSDLLGLTGKADVVEFHTPGLQPPSPCPATPSPDNATPPRSASSMESPEDDPLAGSFAARFEPNPNHNPFPKPTRRPLGTPFPIEYKRGRPKKHDADLVQLCAQALCLEEMLALPEGGVAPSQGRGLKRRLRASRTREAVAPSQGRGLKQLIRRLGAHGDGRPFTGARIETGSWPCSCSGARSPLHRGAD